MFIKYSSNSFPSLPRDPTPDEADSRLSRPVPFEQRGLVPTGRRAAVHLRSRGTADRDVPLQVQADEADPDVQGSQALDLLPV